MDGTRGVLTTCFFRATELAFAGAFLGLSAGYAMKYVLDRRFVFRRAAERGWNITVRPAARNPTKALRWGRYAVPVGPGLWMPRDSPNEGWVLDLWYRRASRRRRTWK